jgi:transposase, IS5 family
MGGKQLGFADYEQSTAKKRTKKEKFLAVMDQVVPWQPLLDLMQQWYSLSDPAMEDALLEVPTIWRFAGIELISDKIPDETTILAIIDATLISAPSSKNKTGERDPETHQTKKGNQWYHRYAEGITYGM